MATWDDFEVRIYNNAEPPVLQGTITSSPNGEGVFGLNEIGDGFFVFPADDSAAKALVQRNRIAIGRGYNNTSSQWCIVFCIIIHDITPVVDRPTLIHVYGPGRLHELTYDNLNYNLISDESGDATDTWVGDILAYAQETWVPTGMGTDPTSAYLQAADETLFDALVQLHTQNGHAITYNAYNAPDRNVWFIRNHLSGAAIFDFDDLDLEQPADPSTIEDTANKAVIRKFNIEEQTAEVVTRVHPYGAGLGGGKVTIGAADGFVSLPSGFSADFTNNLIINTDLEAESEQPEITRIKQFSHIKPETIDENDANYTQAQITASVQLVEATVKFLQDRTGSKKTFYHIEAMCHGNYVPGQLVNINFSNSEYTVSGDFILHTIKHVFRGRERISELILGEPSHRRRPEKDMVVWEKIKEIDETLRHATAQHNPASPDDNETIADAPFVLVADHPGIPNRRIAADGLGTVFNDGGVAGDSSWDLSLSPELEAILSITEGETDLDTQAANQVLASPASGSPAKPTFRDLVIDDLPDGVALDGDLHAQVHVLATNLALGPDHTITGATAGHALRASGATTAAFAQLQHGDLGGVGANDHHNQSHVLATTSGLGGDHSVSGLTAGQVLRATGASSAAFASLQSDDLPTGQTITLSSSNSGDSHAIDTSSNPGANDEILATASDGGVQLLRIGLGIDPDIDNLLKVVNQGKIGLGNSAGHLLFNDAGTDQIKVVNADLVMNDGSTDRLWFRHSGDVDNTESDIYADNQLGLGAESNVGIFIDGDNNSTTSYFAVLKNAENFASADELMRLTESGSLLIGETANSNQTFGVTVKDSSGDEMLTLKSNVAHGTTGQSETDTAGYIKELSQNNGGIVVRGLSAQSEAIALTGTATTEVTTDTTGSVGVVTFRAYAKSGTGQTSIGSNANGFAFRNGGTTRFLVKGGGDLHATNTTITALDGEDDIALVRQMQIELSRGRGILPSIVDSRPAVYSRDDLVKGGMIAGDFLSIQGSIGLLLGANVQTAAHGMENRQIITELIERVQKLENLLYAN